MKSLDELKKLREEASQKINLRTTKNGYRVVVGMATCGIAAGARPVLAKVLELVNAKQLDNVMVTQVGCIGECALEPIVEVYDKDGNRTTYGKVTPFDVEEIIEQHIMNGQIIEAKRLENLKAK